MCGDEGSRVVRIGQRRQERVTAALFPVLTVVVIFLSPQMGKVA
jgi:hypothetical protein